MVGYKPETLNIIEEAYSNIAKSFTTSPKDVTFNTPQDSLHTNPNISFILIDHLYDLFHLLSSKRKDSKDTSKPLRYFFSLIHRPLKSSISPSLLQNSSNLRFIEEISKKIQNSSPKPQKSKTIVPKTPK